MIKFKLLMLWLYVFSVAIGISDVSAEEQKSGTTDEVVQEKAAKATEEVSQPAKEVTPAKASEAVKAVDGNKKPDPNDQIKDPELLKRTLKHDIIYGKETAPVTIIEYASLSCPHCKDFHKDIFGKVKEKYVDSGQIRFVFRHFPLNLPALRAAQLVECVQEDETKKKFLDALFKSQDDWAYSKSEDEFIDKLKVIGKVGGLDRDTINKCLADKQLEEELLTNQVSAGKGLGIASTPTVFINGKVYTEKKVLEDFVKAVDAAILGSNKDVAPGAKDTAPVTNASETKPVGNSGEPAKQ